MNARQRHTIVILIVVLVSLTLHAAPARGADWFGVGVGSHGFSLSFGSTDWAVWGGSWQNPGWSVDYHVALAGYGEWLWVDGLGLCWQPWVPTDWRPFTHCRWVWTSLGWTWVSYEPWGYFPHHFGHWAMAPVGWVWMPGTSYHPANVVWVSGGPWVGWYPRPPFGWHHDHGHHGHHDAYWAGWNDARYATFVGWHDLGSDDLGRHAVGASVVRDNGRHAVPREGVTAPTRRELGERGVAVPEMSLERRTARVAVKGGFPQVGDVEVPHSITALREVVLEVVEGDGLGHEEVKAFLELCVAQPEEVGRAIMEVCRVLRIHKALNPSELLPYVVVGASLPWVVLLEDPRTLGDTLQVGAKQGALRLDPQAFILHPHP